MIELLGVCAHPRGAEPVQPLLLVLNDRECQGGHSRCEDVSTRSVIEVAAARSCPHGAWSGGGGKAAHVLCTGQVQVGSILTLVASQSSPRRASSLEVGYMVLIIATHWAHHAKD